MDAQQRINSSVAEIQEILDGLSQQYSNERTRLEKILEDIAAKQSELDKLESDAKYRKAELDKVLADTSKLLEESQENLVTVQGQVDNAKQELVSIKKQHAQFVAYQVRAQKALDAADKSIAEREESLEIAVAQARRRSGVLSSVDK